MEEEGLYPRRRNKILRKQKPRPISAAYNRIYDNNSYRFQLINQFIHQIKMQEPPGVVNRQKRHKKDQYKKQFLDIPERSMSVIRTISDNVSAIRENDRVYQSDFDEDPIRNNSKEGKRPNSRASKVRSSGESKLRSSGEGKLAQNKHHHYYKNSTSVDSNGNVYQVNKSLNSKLVERWIKQKNQISGMPGDHVPKGKSKCKNHEERTDSPFESRPGTAATKHTSPLPQLVSEHFESPGRRSLEGGEVTFQFKEIFTLYKGAGSSISSNASRNRINFSMDHKKSADGSEDRSDRIKVEYNLDRDKILNRFETLSKRMGSISTIEEKLPSFPQNPTPKDSGKKPNSRKEKNYVQLNIENVYGSIRSSNPNLFSPHSSTKSNPHRSPSIENEKIITFQAMPEQEEEVNKTTHFRKTPGFVQTPENSSIHSFIKDSLKDRFPGTTPNKQRKIIKMNPEELDKLHKQQMYIPGKINSRTYKPLRDHIAYELPTNFMMVPGNNLLKRKNQSPLSNSRSAIKDQDLDNIQPPERLSTKGSTKMEVRQKTNLSNKSKEEI